MDKDKLRERKYIAGTLHNFAISCKNSLDGFTSKLSTLILRVRIENEKYYIRAIEKVEDAVRNIKVESTFQISDDKQIASLSKSIQDAVKTLKPIPPKDFPKEMQVSVLPTKLYESITDLKSAVGNTEKAIRDIRLPTQETKQIEFPKDIEVSNLDTLKRSVEKLEEAIKSLPNLMPRVEFPNEIKTHVLSEPPRLTPQPVTNFNINPIRGTILTQSMTITGTATQTPATNLARRRSIQIYNTSSTEYIEIGGLGLTYGSGMVVPPKSYSQALDIDEKTALYAVTDGSSVQIRVLEISNDLGGP